MNIVMLKCGCNGMATHGNEHDGLPAYHPTCIVHETCEVVETPSFEGRTARCDHYGTAPGRRNECSECRGKTACECEKPSSINLAFFQSQPEKEHDSYYCGCAFGWDQSFLQVGIIIRRSEVIMKKIKKVKIEKTVLYSGLKNLLIAAYYLGQQRGLQGYRYNHKVCQQERKNILDILMEEL